MRLDYNVLHPSLFGRMLSIHCSTEGRGDHTRVTNYLPVSNSLSYISCFFCQLLFCLFLVLYTVKGTSDTHRMFYIFCSSFLHITLHDSDIIKIQSYHCPVSSIRVVVYIWQTTHYNSMMIPSACNHSCFLVPGICEILKV
jgi:hypothetical protein